MKSWLKPMGITCALWICFIVSGASQNPSDNLKASVDALIVTAYQSASAQFPCKLKAEGKLNMLHWQEVEACLNGAESRVDWERLSQQLEKLRQDEKLLKIDLSIVVESALSAHPIRYDKVFSVKNTNALLPLSNTLLKFLPPDSLQNLPVFAKSGERIGTFAGAYSFEKAGGLNAGTSYRMSMFQYTDLRGTIQSPSIAGRLLLDSFGVPWKDASSQSGFRLTADKLSLDR